jgi:hypothetical protein
MFIRVSIISQMLDKIHYLQGLFQDCYIEGDKYRRCRIVQEIILLQAKYPGNIPIMNLMSGFSPTDEGLRRFVSNMVSFTANDVVNDFVDEFIEILEKYQKGWVTIH